MGGGAHDVEVVDFESFGVGGGFDGRDEKRFTPGSDATMAINKNQAFFWTNSKLQSLSMEDTRKQIRRASKFSGFSVARQERRWDIFFLPCL